MWNLVQTAQPNPIETPPSVTSIPLGLIYFVSGRHAFGRATALAIYLFDALLI